MSHGSTSSIGRQGRCLCGAIRFVAEGNPRWVAHCHCESCRRATSAPITTYAGFAASDVVWSGEAPAEFHSSPGVVRRFCRRCGSPMSFASDSWPDEIHLFVASFGDAADFAPTLHVHVEEQLPWLHLADGLPRFAKTARDAVPLS